MTTIDHLIKVCKAIPGFRERLRSLSDLAGKAIVEGIILSGQTVPVAGQRYIRHTGTSTMSSYDHIGSTTSGNADRQTYTLPPLQDVTEHSTGSRSTPSLYPMSGLMAIGRQGGDVHNLTLQSQPDAELVRRQEIIARTTPVTGHRYIDHPRTAEMPSNNQVGSATSGIANRHTFNSLPSVQEVNEQPGAGVLTPAPFSVLGPAALGQRVENVQSLPPERQPNAELVPRRESIAQSASFRLSPNVDTPIHPTSTEADEVLLQQRAENYPGFHTRSLFATNQGYGDLGVGDTAWDGSSYNTQSEGLNPEFWPTFFPLYN